MGKERGGPFTNFFLSLAKESSFPPRPNLPTVSVWSDDGDVEDDGGVICDAGDGVGDGDDGDADDAGDDDYNDAAEASCFPTSPPLLANC